MIEDRIALLPEAKNEYFGNGILLFCLNGFLGRAIVYALWEEEVHYLGSSYSACGLREHCARYAPLFNGCSIVFV
jgi:hypothetical protein